MLPQSVLQGVLGDLPENMTELNERNARQMWQQKSAHISMEGRPPDNKYGLSDMTMMGKYMQGLMTAMKSQEFRHFLETLSGIGPLMNDDTNEGGGIHQTGPGGSLQIHADFNGGETWHRRVNAFVMLNPDWEKEWNGDLELWTRDMERCEARMAPIANRLVIFSTTDYTYHGHADPLFCPNHRSRRSVAMYYYTKTRPEWEIKLSLIHI